MPPQGRVLTPEQLALSEARKRRKAEAAALTAASASPSQHENFRSLILPRRFLSESVANISPLENTVIMTWNVRETVLAQCLVRRELFPTSDCLKANQREGMLFEEITRSGADIICLQEVDRLERLGPVLESANYAFTYSSGRRKKHGCIIAYKKDEFVKTAERTIFYDDINIRHEGTTERSRKGSSFRTKNIGLILALQRCGNPSHSIVVATTHLFWHPKYTYERARQALILVRSVCEFKEENNLQDAPGFIAGVGDTLLPQQEADIKLSHVVHVSLDPTVSVSDPKRAATDDEEEEGAEADPDNDPDRVIKNARSASPDDGLLEPRELVEMFAQLPTLRSAYDLWGSKDVKRMFGARVDIPADRQGRSEPMYTSYTHYWKVTLGTISFFVPIAVALKYSVS
ncbi:Endonuclease/exonuclease/phosphatase [Sanghuangporus baumii]|uniref:Endonuclease/exonuclease/phosphatase n=1 Tax=Sanghuangporus baumii TaxID=108892 RepID=A0A9Q5HTH9_SANBA|nr:Endonuclease/exonuclease/phosphatase [Sanghuangporus baumii]